LPTKRKCIPAVSGLYGALSLACYLLASIYWEWKWPLSYLNFAFWVLVTAAPLILALKTIRRAFSMEFREAIAHGWQELRQSQMEKEKIQNHNLPYLQETEQAVETLNQ
jgi:hypothetical protein